VATRRKSDEDPEVVMSKPALAASAAAAAAAAVVATLVVGPKPPAAPRHTSGDAALAPRVIEAMDGGDGVHSVAVAWIEGDRVTTAGLGPDGETVDAATPFETGSLMKTVTGMLLADAAGRGEVRTGQTVDSIEPGIGAATLQDLATHRSGLPRLPGGPRSVLAGVWSAATAGNPYAGATADGVLAAARKAKAPGGRDYAYSNLGAAVLGQVLASRAGRPYPDLVRERVLAPLGMGSTRLSERVPPGGAAPVAANGRRQSSWYGIGYAPAGVGWWSTAADLARLVAATMDGTAPGAGAAVPVAATGTPGRGIGLGWLTESGSGATLTWHNGGTGGTRTFMGYDAGARRGVVLLATTTSDVVDTAGFRLLTER
jgi:CubicO group peptidase (beta-lactamase class C family)